ncbi:DUF1963 domain-containing protein [Chitinophaga agri]|uniref:DUF1963 domain-containing protein n=1 Tax=Chitinophaga agri TaxID=2703787 RepID=UPI001EE43149|nr:DUF1963 domain-containing protein [Chitinophaga agri]
MQTASTKTFSVTFPDLYQYVKVAWESIKADHTEGKDYASFAAIGLSDVSFYKKYPGTDFLTRFQASCLEQRGNVEVVADKTLPVAGRTSYIRTATSTDGFFFYYFAVLQISNEYCYNFTADCDTAEAARFEPIFDEIWQSLQYFGDPSAALKEQQAAIDNLRSPYTSSDTGDGVEKEISPFTIPADEQGYWEFGGYRFNILPGDGNEVHIADVDGALYIKLEGQVPDYDTDKHGHLLNDYEHGKVYLQFYFKGIYHNGVPTGTFTFRQERDDTHLSYLWKGGFHYSLDFTGEATLRDGWLGVNGYFNDYEMKIASKLPDHLNWSNYRFLTIDELETAPADIVRRLQLTDPYPGQLHEALSPLTQLETLFIWFKEGNKAAEEIKEVPKAIKKLKALKELNLSGMHAITHIPEWIGELHQLETLHLSNNGITGIHPRVFQLPRLKNCYLYNNQLQSIAPGLPESLVVLNLDNNQLTTVPDSLTRMKALTDLSLNDNPLTHLPAGLENIENLRLEMDKKLSLLNYTYMGADKQGTISYDNTPYFAQHDPALTSRLEKAIAEKELLPYKQGLMQLARKSVAFATTEEEDYGTTGGCRFGGLPDLPAGMPYPTCTNYSGETKGMQFIAQINCTAIAGLQDYLPRTGILYFFIKDQEELSPAVIHYNGDLSTLIPGNTLDISEDFIADQAGIYASYKVVADNYPDIPFFYNARDYYTSAAPALKALEEQDELADRTNALKTALHPSITPVHSINSYVFKQHDTPEKEAANELRGKPEEWMVLLRVSSDNNPGFCFWDAGEIYFVIHKSDLAKQNFSNVYAGLESS